MVGLNLIALQKPHQGLNSFWLLDFIAECPMSQRWRIIKSWTPLNLMSKFPSNMFANTVLSLYKYKVNQVRNDNVAFFRKLLKFLLIYFEKFPDLFVYSIERPNKQNFVFQLSTKLNPKFLRGISNITRAQSDLKPSWRGGIDVIDAVNTAAWLSASWDWGWIL